MLLSLELFDAVRELVVLKTKELESVFLRKVEDLTLLERKELKWRGRSRILKERKSGHAAVECREGPPTGGNRSNV